MKNTILIVDDNISNIESLALLDIDHFKDVNDTYGHDIGDIILKEFVSQIKNYLRTNDILIRWGGEEFVIIFDIPNEESLKLVLEKIRNLIEKNVFTKVGKITCSIGASYFSSPLENVDDVLKDADVNVYEIKNNGINGVLVKKHIK